MHTKDRLAEALREVGLEMMARRAAEGYYDDYLSPLAMPISTLVHDLYVRAERQTGDADKHEAILRLRQRVMEGDFDATKEEADAWAKSPDGQATFAKLKPENRK